jgi:hypothetical protein
MKANITHYRRMSSPSHVITMTARCQKLSVTAICLLRDRHRLSGEIASLLTSKIS